MLTEKELNKYAKLIDDYVKPNIFACCSPAGGIFRHPFVDPSAQYGGSLWDWDSYFVLKVMFLALKRYEKDADFDYAAKKEKTLLHAKGTIYNFLENQEEDGFIPVMLISSGAFKNFYHEAHARGEKHNQHKPFLLQNILQICEFSGEYDWFDMEKALKYLTYYETAQRDPYSGLFFWVDDVMIGVDNNPTVFHRRKESSADIYLNSFIKKEYDAAAVLLKARGDSRAEVYRKKAQDLSDIINNICYDKKDKIYYSQDLSFDRTPFYARDFLLHEGMKLFWNTMPMKVRFWGCFAPIYAGISGKERAEEIEKTHLHDPAVMAKYGVRTVASDEAMYCLEKTSNPSNWLGPVWIVTNWVIYRGLKEYGIPSYRDLAERTIRLLGENLEKSGEMYESYLPDTGEPCLYPHFFNWDLLVLEMLEDFGV